MKKLFAIYVIIAMLLTMTSLGLATSISLPDGTVTADTYYSGHGLNAYWAENVTIATIDAQNLGIGQYVEVSGKITDISDPENSWAEIGLIPKAKYDYWQTAFGGGWKPAVFDKGIYVVHWSSGGLGLSLQEGWDDWGSTTYKKGGPFVWPLSSPTTSNPWSFSFTMHPIASGGNAYMSVPGAAIYGTQPFVYPNQDAGNQNDNDYSECYLIAQIWSNTQDAYFSFTDVKATVIPEPSTIVLLGIGLVGFAVLGKKKLLKK